MTCYLMKDAPPVRKAQRESALARLERALALGTVSVTIGQTGGLAFKNWTAGRDDLTDICAYRALTAKNSPALRKALARAEAMSGRKLDARAIAAGVHSHDGGRTWGSH